MNDGNDIKRLLGRAFGPEPPLALDREEVFKRGQRRVRFRRLAASGGVAASVIAVVLGAVALAGPNLRSPTTAGEASPAPADSVRPSGSLGPPSFEAQAETLTSALAQAKLIPTTIEVRSSGYNSLPPLTFVFERSMYRADANLVDSRGAGTLSIDVSATRGALPPAACPPDPNPSQTCMVIEVYGYPMTLITEGHRSGEIAYYVRTVRPDDTQLHVVSNNVATDRTGQVTRDKPPLDFDVLMKIAALPGLAL